MATISREHSQLSLIQNRNDFIEKFQIEHNYSNRNLNSNLNSNSSSKGRWNYMHDVYKFQKSKLEEKREIKRKKDEEEIQSQCPFTPKLNKSINYSSNQLSRVNTGKGDLTNKTFINNSNIINIENSLNLFNRQEIWRQKKNNRIKELKKTQSKKELEQCYFTPEIHNITDYLNKSHIKSSAVNLVEDPESYTQYLNRMTKKRKEDENKLKRQNSLPGSGNIWTSTRKNYDLNYDYTKHSIINKCYSRSKSRGKLENNRSNSKNIVISIKDKDKYYDYRYQNNKELDNKNAYGKKHILLEQQIEYSQALDLLHKELFDFPLLNEEE